jgi:hypothetical protein
MLGRHLSLCTWLVKEKGKVVPVRDEALLHEDVWGSGGIASNILELGIRWR